MARKDVLKAIKDAEIAAQVTLSDAKKEAASILTNARLNASEIINIGRNDSESDAQNLISEARATADSKANLVSSDGKIAQKSIHESGNINRIEATKLVLDAFRK